jgi:hypothetical protein
MMKSALTLNHAEPDITSTRISRLVLRGLYAKADIVSAETFAEAQSQGQSKTKRRCVYEARPADAIRTGPAGLRRIIIISCSVVDIGF